MTDFVIIIVLPGEIVVFLQSGIEYIPKERT